ncbi:MAG: 16S rRNA (guanine(527)-N(7))-methyltransferase RsmG [Lachnospiraceae bacterium]
MNRKKYLYECFHSIGINLTEVQQDQFITFYDMLIEKNKVMNLTAITEFEDVVVKHFMDSVMIPEEWLREENISLIDVGTGAGFPGIPLKIVYPNLEIVLLDSLNKRINFLEEVIEELELTNIKTIHARAEDGGKRLELREKFDISVSRAVANLATLAEYCVPFLKIGGRFISYKSADIDKEVKAASKAFPILGGELEMCHLFEIPNTDISRSFVSIKKVKSTPKKYPRKAGLPGKEPLSK